MKSESVHFSSETVEWATPQWFYDELNAKYGPFDLDPCSTHENAKCPLYLTKETDGLSADWSAMAERVYMNPPYGRVASSWVKKAYEESLKGATVVCLLPARTDTQWFHRYCMQAAEVVFLEGRLKFGGATNSAPFPSMLVVFRKNADTITITGKKFSPNKQ